MKCACGGEQKQIPYAMFSAQPLEPLPRHRKSRIQKKRFKGWLERTRSQRMQTLMVGAMGPKGFVCTACGVAEGFYRAMARSMITVTPLENSDGGAQ